MRISIITATLNCIKQLPALSKSLTQQGEMDFEWVVIDGGSVDGTLQFLEKFSERFAWCRYKTGEDFGIYDALNKGIRMAKGDYYIVAGSDDYFFDNALVKYRDAIDAFSAPVLLAGVSKDGIPCKGFRPHYGWLGHQRVFLGNHSVGMAIRKDLHKRYGYYSSRFPLLADGYFLKRLLAEEPALFSEADFMAGNCGTKGISARQKLQSLSEGFQIQMLTEEGRFVQLLIFLGKLMLRAPYLINGGRFKSELQSDHT